MRYGYHYIVQDAQADVSGDTDDLGSNPVLPRL
jgi:hypothetical protein